jgi:ribonucleoside-diphosphate reductase alpha chain
MYIIKSNGKQEEVKFDKIFNRIKLQMWDLDESFVDVHRIAQLVIGDLRPGMSTREIDELAAQTAAHMTLKHPDYKKLAARICVSALHKRTDKSFSKTIKKLHGYKNEVTGKKAPKISDELMEVVKNNADVIDSEIIHARDYEFDYFGYKTLERAYLQKIDGVIVERPQYMWMRVALGIWGDNLEQAFKTYHLMSNMKYIHATPTLFNSGTPKQQMSSCFLLDIDDSIDGIFKTLSDAAKISKYAGGLGLAVSKIRASGSYINGTGGTSNGLVPMLRVFNNTMRYVDQCFTGDSSVQTKEGLKPMCELTDSDYVLTSSGEYKKIKAVKEFELGDNTLYEVNTVNGTIKVTGDHIFMCVNNENLLSNEELIHRIENSLIEIEWVEAKNLKNTHLILS